jgi:Ca2+-binding EF-hand superfamily protein
MLIQEYTYAEFDSIDANGDGAINFNEFVLWIKTSDQI